MRDPYIYLAQCRAHPSDPMYGAVFTRRYDMANWIKGDEPLFNLFSYSPSGECKVIELTPKDYRYYR